MSPGPCFLVLAVGLCLAPSAALASDGDWQRVEVPDAWKSPPGGALAPRDGWGWYRGFVEVPAAWRGRDLELFVEPVDDARQIYVNGRLVGAAGTLPPLYRSGLGEPSSHVVPSEAVEFGALNLVAVRIFVNEGRTNFSVAPPVLLADRGEAIRMAGPWHYRPGDDLAWARLHEEFDAASLDVEVYRRVDTVDDVERYVRERDGDRPALTPAEALARFEVPDDLAIDLVLAEPDIAQPLFFDFDERGRLWVLEYRQYPNPAGLTMVSRDKYLRTVYDRVPEPPPAGRRGADRISIHEDADGDGRYETHGVFVDGLNIATSFALVGDDVWVLNPPYLLRYTDGDRDDRPEGDPEVVLEGFGLQDTHSVTNSLCLGPDGWLYASQGSTVTGAVRRYGSDDEPVRSLGQLIWRFHPTRRVYEIFAEGGGNAFGVEIDSKGRIFSGHNGGDTRGFHYVQGSYSQKGFGKHGELSNPYAFGYFPPMPHNRVPRFTHDFVIYDDEALPERYRGKLFGVEPLQGQVVLSEVTPVGSSFTTNDISRPVKTDDQWFRPVHIKTGPDGAVWFADFYEQRIDHSSHYAGRVDATSGRIYRLRARDGSPSGGLDLSKRSTGELVAVLAEPTRSKRRTALRLLAARDGAEVRAAARPLLEAGAGQSALEALWALHGAAGLDDERNALALLEHADPWVRGWTARLLCDDGEVTRAGAAALAELARAERHPETLSQLAASARRLPAAQALPIIEALLARDELVDDPHAPLLVWWAIESKVDEAPGAVLALFESDTTWEHAIVERHILERIMRRLAAPGTRAGLLACARLLDLAPNKPGAERLMAGFEKALEGRPAPLLPLELARGMARWDVGSLALRLRQDDDAAFEEALRVVRDAKTSAAEREHLVQTLGEVPRDAAIEPLLDVARSDASSERLRAAALGALRAFEDERIAEAVIALWPRLGEDARRAGGVLLASRKPWARQLLDACETGDVAPEDVGAVTARTMLLHGDDRIATRVTALWDDVAGATTDAIRERIDALRDTLRHGQGSPERGERLYGETCGRCHRLFDQGGDVGPDLTPFQRGDLERLLLNVVNPSAEIREGFESHVAMTRDGRIVEGLLVDRTEHVVVLRGVDGQNVLFERSALADFRASERSLMPEGLLDGFDATQVRDFFAYLRSAQPLP